MGLGNIFGGSFGSLLQGALPLLGTVIGGPLGGAAGGLAAGLLTGFEPIGAPQVPSVPDARYGGFVPTPVGTPGGVQFPGPGDVFDPSTGMYWPPAEQFNGGLMRTQPVALPAVAAGAGVVAAMSARLASAVLRVGARMGVSLVSFAGLSRFAGRLWRSVTSFARRHPNVSSVALLTSLGFAVEEASEFLAWGTTRRRRRRGGISGRDIRITRRTLRRLASVRTRLGVGGFGARRARRGSDGVSVVRAG